MWAELGRKNVFRYLGFYVHGFTGDVLIPLLFYKRRLLLFLMVFGIWRNGHFMNCHSMYFYPTVITNLFMYTSLPSKYLLSWGVFLKRSRECPEIKEKFVWPTSLKQHYNLAKRGKGLAEFYQWQHCWLDRCFLDSERSYQVTMWPLSLISESV